MGEWSRRQVLRALAGGALAGPPLAGWLAACGPAGAGGRRGRIGPRTHEGIWLQVRELVEELSAEYVDVTAQVSTSRRGSATVDGQARATDVHHRQALVLAATSGGIRYEQATRDLTGAGIQRAASWLRTRAPRDPAARPTELGEPERFEAPVARDPSGQPTKRWLDEVAELHDRGQRVGGSRIVYRGAYLEVDDTTTSFIGRGRDLTQRLVRTRAGLLLVAWTGTTPSADRAERAGALGLEALELPVAELEAAAEGALAQLTARPTPEGAMQIILEPDAAALLAIDALGPALAADRWLTGRSRLAAGQVLCASGIDLVDDPTLAGGYGSYYFDDEGHEAARTPVIEAGTVLRPLTDRATAEALAVGVTGHGRRRDATAAVHPVPSNLMFGAGKRGLDDLMAGVDRGLIVQGARSLEIDRASLRLVIRASHGRGIEAGKLTGARYGELEIRSGLDDLMAAAIPGGEVVMTARRRGELALSGGGPHLLTRAEVLRG